MSIAAKQTLLQNMQMQLSSTLTVDNLDVVIDILTEQLDQFDVESVKLDTTMTYVYVSKTNVRSSYNKYM